MENQLVSGAVSIALAIVGIAVIAVLVGQNSQTGSVIQAATSGFASDIEAAVAPVSGGFGNFSGGGASSLSIH
jgi:hypothetical protein